MLTYFVKWRKTTKNLYPKNFGKKKITQPKFSVCETITSRFAKEQEAKGLLTSLGLETPLIKVLL